MASCVKYNTSAIINFIKTLTAKFWLAPSEFSTRLIETCNCLIFSNNKGMRKRLPPLNALRTFEAAARHSSFKGAGDELCVSHSAVSHQIKKIEKYLGIASAMIGRCFDQSA